MKSLINALENLPFIVKLLLCIPAIDIIWSVYKLCRSIDKGNIVGIILAVLTVFPGAFFIWIIDIVTLIIKGNVWWID